MKERLPLLMQALASGAVLALVAFSVSFLGGRLFGDWRLVLQGLQDTTRFWGLVAGAIVAVGCLVTLFQYERRLIQYTLGTVLLTLRLLAILVLFLALLEPIWTWSYVDERTGRVLVALDSSESMDTRDESATRAEKLRWARALGMIAQGEQVAGWIADDEASREPQWVGANETNDPEKRDQLARARQENVAALCREVDKLSRLEIARRIVVEQPQGLLSKINEYAQSGLMLFAGKSISIESDNIGPLRPDNVLDTDRNQTDLTQPLTAALAGPTDPPLAGIIVFSDGRDTAHPELNDFLGRITGLGVPIHTVLVGSSRRPRDLSVVTLDYPESVFQDDTPVVTAILNQSGYDGQEAVVVLESLDGNQEEPISQRVELAGDAVEVSFPLKDLAAGQHRYRLKIEPLPEETRDDNNDRELAIQVVDDKSDVLLVEGEARWEFRYLEAALSRDKQVALKTVLFEQPFLHVLPTTFFPRKLALKPQDPAARQDVPAETTFKEYDVVIVGDVSPTQLGGDSWAELDRYVREEGGTLVLVAGQRYMPVAYNSRIMQDLLPIEAPRVITLNNAAQFGPPQQRGFRLRITPDGALQDMLLMDPDPALNEAIWRTLPGHPWGVVGSAKPASTVWAAAIAPGEPTGLEAERNNAVIAQHVVGAGQVVWIGIDSTWRWRLRAGDTFHHRFWGQLARWAVDFKATEANGIAKFGLVKPIISEVEEAVVRLRWDQRFRQQNPAARAKAVIAPVGPHTPQDEITLEMQPSSRRGQEEARITKLKPGQYTVKLAIDGAQVNTPLPEAQLMVNRELTAELKDVSANRELLERMAHVTGGKFFLPDEVDQIPELFSNVTQRTSIHEEVPLYSHWSILALFATFMTAEWVLRKLNGLP